MNKNMLFIIGGAVIILVAGAAQFLPTRSGVSSVIPTATSTGEQSAGAATTTPAPVTNENTTSRNPAVHPLPVISGESIASWDFKGAYTDNPELVAKARSEINRLSSLLAAATSSASEMILSVGIANQYELLGDGKKQYEYLGRAVQAVPTNGLPWHNLGVLMERLGTLETARIAYEKSTLVQPELKFYHYAYIEFLLLRTKSDTARIEKAFAFAEKNIGKTQYLIELRAEWQKP